MQAGTRPSNFLAQDGVLAASAWRPLPATLREHHSIRASGDGFTWPDLLIVPDDSETRLVWGDDSVHSSRWPVRFLTRGDHRVRSVQVQRELELVVTGTLTRLAEQGVAGTVLEKEWAAIQQTDPDEAEYCRAAARLGLDPYSDAAPYEPGILHPLVVIGQNRPATSKRFTLSRALWHYLWDDSPLFMITTAHTYRQRVERAFAAELLAPAEGIAQLLESPPEAASQEELEQIAQRYGVSSMVIEHQLRNHLLAPAA